MRQRQEQQRRQRRARVVACATARLMIGLGADGGLASPLDLARCFRSPPKPSRLNANARTRGGGRLRQVAGEWDAKRGLAIEGARAQYVEMVERLVQKQR